MIEQKQAPHRRIKPCPMLPLSHKGDGLDTVLRAKIRHHLPRITGEPDAPDWGVSWMPVGGGNC